MGFALKRSIHLIFLSESPSKWFWTLAMLAQQTIQQLQAGETFLNQKTRVGWVEERNSA